MSNDAPRSKKAVAPIRPEKLVEGLLPCAQELTFVSRGDPDPRLVSLARLLGKQMARQDFEALKRKPTSNDT